MLNFDKIVELKLEIENYYYLLYENKLEFTFDEFINKIVNKYITYLEYDIIIKLCNINKFSIDGGKLYISIELLRRSLRLLGDKYNSPSDIEKIQKNLLITYSDIFMKTDKLFLGIINKTLDDDILNNILYNMKEIDKENISKTNSDIKIGKILFDKYINIKDE